MEDSHHSEFPEEEQRPTPLEEDLKKAYQGLEDAEKHGGSANADTVIALHHLAMILNELGRFPEALGYLIRARENLETYHGASHALMPDILSGIGDNYLLQKMFAEANVYFEKALGLLETQGKDNDQSSGRILVKIGELNLMEHDYSRAKERFMAALMIFNDPKHRNDFMASDLNYNLGIIFVSEQQYARARSFLERAAAVRLEVFGESSIEYGQSLLVLSRALEGIGEIEEARDILSRALRIWESLLGENSSLAVEARQKLAQLEGIKPSAEKKRKVEKVQGEEHTERPVLELGESSEIIMHLLAASVLLIDEKHEKEGREVLGVILRLLGMSDLSVQADLPLVLRALAKRFGVSLG